MKPYYEDGAVTIYHADCRAVVTLLEEQPAMLLADPPYGLMVDGKRLRKDRYDYRSPRRKYNKNHPPMIGDDEAFDPRHLLGLAKRTVLWGADHYANALPRSRGWLVWDKREELAPCLLSDAELAWTDFATPTRIFRHKWHGYLRASEVGFHVHPTQKPVALMEWIIRQWTDPGDLVLDPYMGSGPVVAAAKNLGRRAIGIELVEEYCEIAMGRLAQGVLDLGEAA